MARQTYYLFGRLNTHGDSSPYDETVHYDRVKFSFCDTPDDLPAPDNAALAIVRNTQKLMFVDNGEWVEVKGKKD